MTDVEAIQAIRDLPINHDLLESAITEALILYRFPEAKHIGLVSPRMWNDARALAQEAMRKADALEFKG